MSKLQPIVYWSKGYGNDEDYVDLQQNVYTEIYNFTVPHSGVYKVHANMTINSGSGGGSTVVNTYLYKNLTVLANVSETAYTIFTSLVYVDNFLAGDNIRVVCFTEDNSWPKVDKTKSPIFIHYYPTGVIA